MRPGGRALVAAATALGLLATLASCAPTTIEGSEARVAVIAPFTSYNADSSYGRASATNGDVARLTGSGFGSAGPDGSIVLDPSFGTAEAVQTDPLIVRYTLAEGLRWSDGAPLTTTDLLLAWAANSGALNDPAFDPVGHIDPETGRLSDDYPEVVHFDGRLAGGLEQAVAIPQLVDERSLLVRFEHHVPAWPTVLAPGLPAHIVAVTAGLAERADGTGGSGAEAYAAADEAVRAAIQGGDAAALAALSRAWNLGFDLAGLGEGAAPPPVSGPYRVVEADDGEVVLAANPLYSGAHRPTIETLRLVVSGDPLETAELLERGRIDVATPPPSPDLVAALGRLDGVTTTVGLSARAEHLDLRITGGRSGVFADPRVREAFLLTVPRQRIVDELLRPVAPQAEILDSFTLRETDPAYPEAVAANGSSRYARPDVARARALLAEVGLSSPEVCVLFDPADPRRRASFDLVVEAAADAGFRVTDCSRSGWEAFLGVNGAYDAAIFSWDTARLDREAIGWVFHSGSAVANLNGFADAAADAIVERLQQTDDPDAVTALLRDLDAIVWASGYGLPLYTYPTITAVRDGLDGVSRSPLEAGVLGSAWEWRPSPVD